MRIGEVLRRERRARGLTQARFADLLNQARGYEYGGCGANDVYRWEKEIRTPREWWPYIVSVLGLEGSDLADPAWPTLAKAAPSGPRPDASSVEGDGPVDRRDFMGAGAVALTSVPLSAAGASASQKPERAGGRVGAADVDRLRERLVDLRRLDDYTGGAATYPLALKATRRAEYLLDQRSYTLGTKRELLDVVAETNQFTAWTAFDAGQMSKARKHAQRASAAANQAGNAMLAASALSELSYLTASGDSPAEAVSMARGAMALAPHGILPAVRVVLADRLAWACARVGDGVGVDRAVGLAEDLHDERDAREEFEPDWVYWINRDESKIMAGRCWAQLREHKRAVPTLERVTAPYDDSHAREVALLKCWLAGSYLDAGEIEQAARCAEHAVDLVQGTDSPRTDTWVDGVLQRMKPYQDVASVHGLLERTATV